MANVYSGDYIQIGSDATATRNFVLRVPASPDGTITFKRGNVGAESETEFSISAAGVITFPQGIVLGSVITEIPRCAIYQWTPWAPSDVSGTSTNAPATAAATSTATSYVTMANASGTVTFTFAKAGVYNIALASGLSTQAAALTIGQLSIAIGGSATRLITPTILRADQRHDDYFNAAFNFSVVATAAQTLTVLPAIGVTGSGTTASFAGYANASAAYMGT